MHGGCARGLPRNRARPSSAMPLPPRASRRLPMPSARMEGQSPRRSAAVGDSRGPDRRSSDSAAKAYSSGIKLVPGRVRPADRSLRRACDAGRPVRWRLRTRWSGARPSAPARRCGPGPGPLDSPLNQPLSTSWGAVLPDGDEFGLRVMMPGDLGLAAHVGDSGHLSTGPAHLKGSRSPASAWDGPCDS